MKIKNKKLLAAFCIPLIISIMVLPLCSWVDSSGYIGDGDTYEYYYYRSRCPVDVGFSLNFEDEYEYVGYLPSINSFLLNSIYTWSSSETSGTLDDSFNSLIALDCYNYYIQPLSPWSESNIVPSLSYLDSFHRDNDPLVATLIYSTIDGFTGEFIIDELCTLDDLNNLYISFYHSNGSTDDYESYYSLADMTYSFYDVTVVSYSPLSDNYRTEINTVSIDRVNARLLSVGEFISSYFGSLSLITYISFIPQKSINSGNYDAISITDVIYDVNTYDIIYDTNIAYREIYDDAYGRGVENGYDSGYQQGYFDALNGVQIPSNPEEFSGLGEFLITSVGAFVDFEIIPNVFSLGDIIAIFAGAMVLIAFLKIFAGG